MPTTHPAIENPAWQTKGRAFVQPEIVGTRRAGYSTQFLVWIGGEGRPAEGPIASREAADEIARRMNVERLATAFAAIIREWTTPGELAEIRRRNASPEYAGEGPCATHDFMDANDAMSEAYQRALGRACRLPCDADEGQCSEEEVEADMSLWNAAWSHAKREYLTDKGAA